MLDLAYFEQQASDSARKNNQETEWSEHLDGFSTYRSSSDSDRHQDAQSMVWSWIELPLLLSLIGMSSALLSFMTGTVLTYDYEIKQYVLSFFDVAYHWPVYCIYCVTMSLIACFLCQLICKEAVGGGLSDMRTILGGVVKPVLLSRRLIVAKMLGLWFSLMAGLSVGKEGPFVQTSGAIADQLMKLSIFQHIRRQDSKRLEILQCACASGVSATFGNAFGGVLFSIEFTASAYMVRTLPKAFLTSVVAMISFLFWGISDEMSLFPDEIPSIYVLPKVKELVVFFFIGIAGAFIGLIFVYLVEVRILSR
jgi:H+/Cl- antiporter ClcA